MRSKHIGGDLMTIRAIARSLLLTALIATGLAQGNALAAKDEVTVAALRFVSTGPLFIAREQGYFEEQGIDAKFVFFNAAQPVAVAIASGDADFGVTAFSAGFFNIAAQGRLQVVAAQLHEVPGFEGSAILASNQAYEKGLTAVEKLPGHSFAMTQNGSSFHYMIGQIAQNVGFELSEIRLRALQDVGNMIGALRSGQVDSMIIVPHIAKPLVESGNAKLLGWVADYAPYQGGGLFTSTDNVRKDPDLVRRFVTAYQQGVRDYRAAFIEGDEEMLEKVVAMLHKYVYHEEAAKSAYPKIINGAMYITEGAALNVEDVYRQVEWFKAQGLVNAAADPRTFVSTEFVDTITMPAPQRR